MSNEKELVVDIKDLIVYVIKRWYILIIVAITCSIVLGGYKLIGSNGNDDRYSDENELKLIQKLTVSESNEIENLFSRYLAYKNSISYSESYLSNSILMQLDPNKLPSLVVQYSVDSDRKNIISSFTSLALGISEHQRIAAVFGNDTDTSRITELITISDTSSDKDEVSLDIDHQSNNYSGSLNNIYKCIMSVLVYAKNKDQCESIMEIIEESIMNQYQSLLDAGVDVLIVRIGSNYTENSSNWLADRQRSMISQASSLKSEYDKFEKNELTNISSDQKKYFDFLKDRFEGKEYKPRIIRYFALGGILGFSISLFFIVLAFFSCGRIKSKEDFLNRVSSDDVLGIVYSVEKHRGLLNKCVNKLINKIRYNIDNEYDPTEKANIIAKRIRNTCVKEKISEIYIVDESTKQNAKTILDSISDSVTQGGISVNIGKPLSNSKDFEVFEKSKTVLYYGNLFDSKTDMLSEYYKLFKENNAKVLGSVLHSEI